MAKFSQTVSALPKNQEERASQIADIKKKFAQYKNPFASQNPFKDGEEVEVLGIVSVHWEHDTYGKGDYLALAFKNRTETLALSSLLKEVTGYKTGDKDKDTEPEEFRNPNTGLAKLIREKGWNEDTIDAIAEWCDNKPKRKVKLTFYYLNRGDNRKKCSLTNLI